MILRRDHALAFSLLLLTALSEGACHRRHAPPAPTVAGLPKAPAVGKLRPAPARTPPRPFTAAAATSWGPEPQARPAPEPPRAVPPQQPSTIEPAVYDTTPSRLPMWRQRAKNY
jgi:hypothetical protein